ncbi:MAG: DUF1631 family protein [Rudaea sp.]|uniref:DUF1631 family protein n=1 Tax=Rudaea sp. TaxID=2136325 RepID=UPI0039E463FE
MSTSVYTTHSSASSPGAAHDSGHGQDWWSRLSRTQIDLLRPLVSSLFEKLDDALFDRSGSSFQQFFEGMRILRRSREALVQAWFDRLDEGWNALRPLAPGAFKPRLVSRRDETAAADASFADLALIDEKTLERKLAVETAVARGAALCRMELPPLVHRLTLLRKGAEVEEGEVPAAPSLLMKTFAQSMDDVPGLPVEVTLVAFKLFDRVVMGTIGVICQELNRLLMQGGVAPQWNWSPMAASRPAAARSPAPRNDSAAAAAEWGDRAWLETVPAFDSQARVAHDLADAAAGGLFDAHGHAHALNGFASEMDPARLTASVRALLEHRRLARYVASGAAALAHAGASAWNVPAAPAVPRALDLRTLMEVLASLPPPELPASWVGDAEEESWNPGMLKDELRRSLDHHIRGGATAQRGAPPESADQPQGVAFGEHEDVIDMVAMMFGFIQKDRALPSAVQALLSRLQLPYLRLALVDPALFSDAEHPARALMDRLAEVGKTCTPDNPMLAERMLKMHSLVARIVGNHDITRGFFEDEWVRFRAWSDALAQRAAAREQELAVALAEAEARAPAANEAAASESELAEFLASVKQAASGVTAVVAQEATAVAKPALAAQQAASTPVDAATERARLHRIRLAATAKMRERLEGKVMPDGLRHALSLLWVNHQVRIGQEHGERSYEASSLERRLDAIVALLDGHADAKTQAEFDRDWPAIERAWNAVLAEGPAPAEARTRWIATFRRWAEIRIGRAVDDAAAKWDWYEGMTAAPVAQAQIAESMDTAARTAVVPPIPESAPAEAASQPASSSPVRSVPGNAAPARWAVGDWIEFKSEAGETDAADAAAGAPVRNGRGKVSWIGSFTGRTVLVKTDGTLWREENRADLDDLIDRGLAFVVPRAPLFGRSLQSMFERLREGAVPTTLSAQEQA